MNTARLVSKHLRLAELLSDEVPIPPAMDAELSGIELDSRRIEPGDLFLACKGANFDGRAFVDDVIARGASAVLVEAGDDFREASLRNAVPVIPIDKLACRIGKLAARFFGYPGRDLWLVGVTGTNGKTSTCQFIAQLYTLLGTRCGVSGTLGHGLYGEGLQENEGPGTTPDAITVQRILEDARRRQARAMAMEVSSHGLRQKRVNLDEFDVAVFTNLSRDHLDYHGTMEAYGEAKRRLFEGPALRAAVLNLDDHFSASILNTLSPKVKTYTYSLRNRAAQVHALSLEYRRDGFAMRIRTPWGEGEVRSGLLGAFNVCNLLAGLCAVLAGESEANGVDLPRVLDAASKLSPVRGRMEIVGGHALAVVVDYAHTPDGLKNALEALRLHYPGRIWCVFGCGGERDRGKRPLMARVAEGLADRIVITDDNPRHESSATIIEQIAEGLRDRAAAIVESNRAKAIALAINEAQEGDVVLIAGKGHEDYQDVNGQRTPFSDLRQARLCLSARFAGKGGA